MVNAFSKRSWFIVGGFIVLKLVLSIPMLSVNPIDLDEPFSIYHANQSWEDLFHLFRNENNPPLHFILLKLWMGIFGNSVFSVRSLSLIFSVFTIPVLYRLGIRFFTPVVAIILCFLFVFSNFHHYFGLEARGYSLFVFLFSLLLFNVLKFLTKKTHRTVQIIGFATLHIALFYAHYLSLFVFAGELLLLFVFFRKFKLRELLLLLSIVLLGILPWIGILFTRISAIGITGTWLQEAQYSELYGNVNKFFNGKYVVLFVLFFGLIGAYIQRKELLKNWRTHATVIFSLSFFFFSTYLLLFLASRIGVLHLFYDRYLYFLSLPLFVLAALFFGSFSWKTSYFPIGFAVVFLIQFQWKPNNHRDGNELALWVKAQHPEVITVAPGFYNLTFLYHYDRDFFFRPRAQEMLFQKGIVSVFSLSEFEKTPLPQVKNFVFIDANASFGKEMDKRIQKNTYNLNHQKTFQGGYVVKSYRLLNN